MTKPSSLDHFKDVYHLLHEVRLRPSVWVPRGSLTHLDSMLLSYRVAMAVHDAEEDFPFWALGGDSPFDTWLSERNGYASSLR